uniref:Uncharacterized protein n=1 Tax=Knipowitschia caucasica TaxID=637954 RepID=A0AAV2LXI7_KNICA
MEGRAGACDGESVRLQQQVHESPEPVQTRPDQTARGACLERLCGAGDRTTARGSQTEDSRGDKAGREEEKEEEVGDKVGLNEDFVNMCRGRARPFAAETSTDALAQRAMETNATNPSQSHSTTPSA